MCTAKSKFSGAIPTLELGSICMECMNENINSVSSRNVFHGVSSVVATL